MEIWKEEESQLALAELNKAVAMMFCKPVREVQFTFVPLIERTQKYAEGVGYTTVREVMGECDRDTGVIRLVPGPRWRHTAVHELVHLYNPTMREATVRRRVPDVIRYLTLLVAQALREQRLAGEGDPDQCGAFLRRRRSRHE